MTSQFENPANDVLGFISHGLKVCIMIIDRMDPMVTQEEYYPFWSVFSSQASTVAPKKEA